MTYREYSNTQINASGISCPLPPRRIYVATTTMGVYYTSNFVSSSTQPTWATINTGLGSLNCIEFHLDPFHGDIRQYVLTDEACLYRREYHGSWSAILTQAQRNAMTGRSDSTSNMICFNIDPSIDGRIWLVASSSYGGEDEFYSSDYGNTWNIVSRIYGGKMWGIGGICAYGDNIYVGDSVGTGNYGYIEWSTNRGSSWNYVTVSLTGTPPICLNELITNGVYYNVPWGGIELHFFRNDGTLFLKYSGIGNGGRRDTMWFNPTDMNHQRLVYDNKVYSTYNDWSTATNGGNISQLPYMISPYCREIDEILVGTSFGNHCIGILHSESDTSSTGIAGTNCATPPYTDSIPNYTLICFSGIQEVKESQIVMG